MNATPVFVALTKGGGDLARRLAAALPGARVHGLSGRVDGADVTFEVVLDVGGQKLPSTFAGKLENGKLVGTLDYGQGTATFEGEKKN